MNDACILALIGLLIAASVAVILVTGRSIWREMTTGLANNEDAQAERRTEERKNARIAPELEQWRDGQ